MEDNSEMPAQALQSNQPIEKKYATGSATKLELIGPGTAKITRGNDGLLTFLAPQSEHEHMEVMLEGDTLRVVHHGGLLRHREPQGPFDYELTIAVLEQLKLSKGLVAEATNIESRGLKVELKDGSSLMLTQLSASELDAKLGDGSRLTASGSATKQKLKLAGESTYQGNELQSAETELEASGKCEAIVRVSKKLKVKASDRSSISYRGDRIELNAQMSESSDLRQLSN